MILTGILKRVGGGISDSSRSGPTFIDALEVSGHPEIRNVRGTRYIIDHVGSAVGKKVSIGILGKAIVAVKHDEGFYQDESLASLVVSNAPLLIAGIVIGVPLVMWSTIAGAALLASMYFYFRMRVRAVFAAVAGA
jgi:hypothetical protein